MYRCFTFLVLLIGLQALTQSALGDPGLIFQSQSREIDADRGRGGQFSSYNQSNPDLGPWSLHPTFPDTLTLSHDSTVTPLLISEATDFYVDVLVIPPAPSTGGVDEEMHYVFTVDSPTPFLLSGQYAQQFGGFSPISEGAGGALILTGFNAVGSAIGNSNTTVPFSLSGVFQPGQVYHLDVTGDMGVNLRGSSSSEDTGSYSMHWSLVVLPEPASLLGVLGLTGLLLRRRGR